LTFEFFQAVDLNGHPWVAIVKLAWAASCAAEAHG
jgi:hypothetical protein